MPFPRVNLDVTLAELYHMDDHEIDSSHAPVLVNAFPSSDLAMTSRYPMNTKYLYQDSENCKPWSARDRARLSRVMAIKLLSLLGQRYTFAAGSMPVVLFDPDVDVDPHGFRSSSGNHARAEALRTSSILPLHQRPQVRFIAGPDDLELDHPGERLATAMPLDALCRLPHVVHPDIHYEILSKACLANSGLPTPRSQVIHLVSSKTVQSMATRCPGFFPDSLTAFAQNEIDSFRAQVNIASENALKSILAHVLPFVLKQTLTVSGGGTYIVHTEAQRQALTSKLQSTFIPMLLSSSTDVNSHLQPATLILSKYIRAVNSYGITFFVRRANGACRFISCSNQVFDNAGFWTGGLIEYSKQTYLEMRFSATLRMVGTFLFSRGYYGPVGIDVLEDADGGQWVVDMNVRTPGSLPVGVLRGHFSTERGLHVAYMLSGIKLPYSRERFLEVFSAQFEEGRIVIVAWYEEVPDGNDDVSWANLALGGETRKELYKLLAKIKNATIDGHGSNSQIHKL